MRGHASDTESVLPFGELIVAEAVVVDLDDVNRDDDIDDDGVIADDDECKGFDNDDVMFLFVDCEDSVVVVAVFTTIFVAVIGIGFFFGVVVVAFVFVDGDRGIVFVDNEDIVDGGAFNIVDIFVDFAEVSVCGDVDVPTLVIFAVDFWEVFVVTVACATCRLDIDVVLVVSVGAPEDNVDAAHDLIASLSFNSTSKLDANFDPLLASFVAAATFFEPLDDNTCGSNSTSDEPCIVTSAVTVFVGIVAAVIVFVLLFVAAFGENTSVKYDPLVFAAAIDVFLRFSVVVVSVVVVSVVVVHLRIVCFLEVLGFIFGKNDVVVVLVVSDSPACISGTILATFPDADAGRGDLSDFAFAATDIVQEETEAVLREVSIELSVDEDNNFNDCESKYVSIVVASVLCEGVG